MPTSSNIQLDFTELQRVKDLLRELPARSITKGLRRGINIASTPIVRSAKRRAPLGQRRLLSKSIGKKIKTFKNGKIVAVIGPRRDVRGVKQTKKGPRNIVPANYAHLVEKGHGGSHPASAHPFLVPALEENKSGAVATAGRIVIETLEKEAAKLAGEEMIQEAIASLLLANTPLTDLVGQAIRPVNAATYDLRPLVTYEISETENFNTFSGSAAWFRVTMLLCIYADTYAAAQQITQAIRAGLHNYAGTPAAGGMVIGWARNLSDVDASQPADIGQEHPIVTLESSYHLMCRVA